MKRRLRRVLRGDGWFEPHSKWRTPVMLVLLTVLMSGAVLVADGIPIVNCKPCIDGSGDWWYCWVFSGCCLIFTCP